MSGNKSKTEGQNIVPSLVEMAKNLSIPESMQSLLQNEKIANAVVRSIRDEITAVGINFVGLPAPTTAQVKRAEELVSAVDYVEALRHLRKEGSVSGQ